MPKRSSGSPRALVVLALTTLVLFAAGEAIVLTRTDSGRILAAKYLHVGESAQVTRLIGKQIHRGLEAVGVPRDSVHEEVVEHGPAALSWRVGLPPGTSSLQVNYAITQCVQEQGAEVLNGRERPGSEGQTLVTLRIGFSKYATHEVVLVQSPRPAEEHVEEAPRVAIVLYGFGESPDEDAKFFASSLPFDVAIAPGAPSSFKLFHAARDHQREVVLHLPLEPINYPQVDPGPGTILVTMKPAKITGTVRHYLEEAGPVAAVANHMGSLATQDMSVMTAVYEELKRKSLPFLHLSPASGAVCRPLAARLGVIYDEPDVMLDAEPRQKKPKALDGRWTAILKEARRRGRLIVMLRATPMSEKWLEGALKQKRLAGVSTVPLSTLLKKPVDL